MLYSDSRIGLLATPINTDLMEELPMVLIPAFGVPFTLVLHLISLINLSGWKASPKKLDIDDYHGDSPPCHIRRRYLLET